MLIEDRKNRIVYISACQKKRERERETEKRGRPRACVFVCKRVCALWYRDGSPALVSSPRPCLAERQRQPPFTLGRFKLSQAMVTSQGVSL